MQSFIYFLNLEENYWYFLALKILLVIFTLELLTFFMGGIFNAIDKWLDVDWDTEWDFDLESLTTVDKILHWLNIGKVPIIIYLSIFLGTFALIGLEISYWFISTKLLIAPIFLLSLFITRFLAGKLGDKLKPLENVSHYSFLGREAFVYDVSFSEIGRLQVSFKLNDKEIKQIVSAKPLRPLKSLKHLNEEVLENNKKNEGFDFESFKGFEVNEKVFIVDYLDQTYLFVKTLEEYQNHIQKVTDKKQQFILKQRLLTLMKEKM